MLYLIAVATGLFATAQSGLNSLLIERWGLTYVIGANAAISLIFIALIFVVTHIMPQTSGVEEFFKAPTSLAMPWWVILPGVFGALIMMGFAYSFENLGAAPTTLIIIATQILASFSWDFFVKGLAPSWLAIFGAVICACGAIIALHWGRA